MNMVGNFMCQSEWQMKMEAELKNQLKATLISTALHLKERAITQEQEIQATLTICDEILSVASDDHTSHEDIVALLLRLHPSMRRVDSTVGVASASHADANLTVLASFDATKPKANPEGQVSICRHFCKRHREVMDSSLWAKLPVELLERICSRLPLSKIHEI